MSTLPKGRIFQGEWNGGAPVAIFNYPFARGLKHSYLEQDATTSIASIIAEPAEKAEWPGTGANQLVFAKYTEQDVAAREVTARRAGFEEGKKQAAVEGEKAVSAVRATVGSALEEFARERELYYQKVEGEVVALSLAMARKILHREAQLDPLMLAAAVRFALQRISEGTRVRLRVNPSDTLKWEEDIGHDSGIKAIIEVIGDAAVPVAGCLLESDLGTTDLSVETQLKEIENGFFDLLNARPARV